MTDTENATTKSATLIVHLEGLDQDGGDVRLANFLNDLDTVRKLLNASDKIVSRERKPTSDYRISGLIHESPAAIYLTAEPHDQTKNFFDQTIEYLFSSLVSIRDYRVIPGNATNAFLDNAVRLKEGLGTRFKRLWLETGKDRTAAIDKKLKDALDDLISSTIVSWGSVKGVVELFNSHSDPCAFNIYTDYGPQNVKCVFKRSMMDKAVEAVNHTVTVTGELKYRPRKLTPYECSVEEIEIHPSDRELPRLEELYGIAPDATGDVKTLEFIRGIRDEWQ